MRALPHLESAWDERLREVAADREAAERAIALADEALASAAGDERRRLLAYLGRACRLTGRVDEALMYFRVAARLRPDDVAAQIRLGETHRCRDEYEDAERILRRALSRARGTRHEDFALQHLGKTLLDLGQTAAAIDCLERALELRRAKSDEALIVSTEAALSRARRIRQGPGTATGQFPR